MYCRDAVVDRHFAGGERGSAMALAARWLQAAWRGPALDQDGFGQSLFQDLQFFWRFLDCRKRAMVWRAPSTDERAHFDTHPLIGRFGDDTVAIASCGGRQWIVRERDWNGWPDPPRYVFFAIEPDGRVWSARDFHVWPQKWALSP